MTRDYLNHSPVNFLKRIGLTFLLSLICLPAAVWSQDAVRPSLAGEAAAEARRQDVDRLPYNLLLGPVRFRVSATIGVEYNDNINLSDDEDAIILTPGGPILVQARTQDDVILRPQVNVDAIWPITQLNTLRLDLGLGYSFYLDHSNANTNGILISPGSQLAFDIFVGDFRINIHDRPQLQQDPIAELALSNVVDYGRFENTAGVGVLWDLNKALLTLGYDHYNYISTTDQFDYLNRHAEILSGTLQVLLTSTIGLGPEGYAVFTRYDDQVLNDSETYAVGAFLETQITNNLKIRIAGGYQWIDFDRAVVDFFGFRFFRDQKNFSDWYANILVSHRLNSSLKQTVSAGREAQLGVNSNFIDLRYVRHTISWNIVRDTLIGTEFFYEDAEDSGGFINEHLHRYGGAITVGYQLTPHITLGARYQYTQKDSDVVLRDYRQNRVSIDGTYSF
jgi:opacity protein-like surface antigen